MSPKPPPSHKPLLGAAAIASAEAAIAGLRDDYVKWASADVETCLAQLATLVGEPGRTGEQLQSLFSILHNIKGMGGTFDYHLVTAAATIACNVLRERDAVPDEALVVVRHCALAIKLVLDKRLTGDGGDSGRALVQKLYTIAHPHLAPEDDD